MSVLIMVLAAIAVVALAVGLSTLMIVAVLVVGPRRTQDEALRVRVKEHYRL